MKNKKFLPLLSSAMFAFMGLLFSAPTLAAEKVRSTSDGGGKARLNGAARTELDGGADRVIQGTSLQKSLFLGVQHRESTTSPLNSPLLDPAPREFIPGKSGLDTLLGYSSLQIQGAAVNTPWQDVKRVEALGLREAAASALAFSREVKVAESRLEQADTQAKQAFGGLLPNVTLRRAIGNETSSPSSVLDPATGGLKETDTHRRTDHAVTLRQPLVDVGTYSDWQRRKSVVGARGETLRGTRGDEYVNIVQSYSSLISSQLLAGLARDYEKQLGELLDYVSQRAVAGASSEADAQRVRARSLTARASRMEQEAAFEASLVEFSRLTNIVPKNVRLPRFEDLQVSLPPTIAAAIEEGMNANPEIKSLQSELDGAEWDRVGGKSKYGPRLDFELTDQKVVNGGGPTGLQHDTRAMVVLTWSLFAGGADYQYNKERDARRDEIRWRLDDQWRKLVQGLTSQYATLDSSRGRLAAGYKELAAITDAARAMSERMLAGNTSLLDLLDVLERVYQTRSRLVTLHVQEINAAAQIGRYLGQPEGMIVSTPEMAATEGGS